MIDDFDINSLLRTDNEFEDQPYWAEYLGIDIAKWPRERLVKLYLHKQHSTKVIVEELYERIDDLKSQIHTQTKLVSELEEKFSKEKIAKQFYRDQEKKAVNKIQQLKDQLENKPTSKPTMN